MSYTISRGEIMKDQYGEQVPDDLVLLPEIEHLDESEIKKVVNADWYKVWTAFEGIPFLMVSAKAIDYLSENNLIDSIGADVRITEMLRVNDVLKRWDTEYGDGFYHA